MATFTQFKSNRVWLSGLTMLILALALSACQASSQNQTAPTFVPLDLGTAPMSATGEVIPVRWATLGLDNGGQQLEILIQPGERVTSGQVLIRSNTDALELAETQALAGVKRAEAALDQLKSQPTVEAVRAAEAALINAKANYDRLDRSGAREIELDAAQAQIDSAQAALDALKAGPGNTQMEAAQAELAAAQAALERARRNLNAAELKAPFDGQVIEVYARDYESAAPSAPLLLLADLSNLRVETSDLSEVDAARVAVGDTVLVSFDALADTTLTGRVIRIADKASPGAAVNFKVTIELEKNLPELRWGMTAFVEFERP